jgi:hypothetical protein
MFYFNSRSINNQAHIEIGGIVIDKLYAGSTLFYDRDISGTSGWLYQGTHTVTVPIGVSSVNISGNGTGGTAAVDNWWAFSTIGWGVMRPSGGGLFPLPNAAATYDYAFVNGNNSWYGVISGLPSNINTIQKDAGYIVCGGFSDYDLQAPRYYQPLQKTVAAAGSSTTVIGAAAHAFAGAAVGIAAAPAVTTITKSVDPYVLKTFTVTVPAGGSCKLDWV